MTPRTPFLLFVITFLPQSTTYMLPKQTSFGNFLSRTTKSKYQRCLLTAEQQPSKSQEIEKSSTMEKFPSYNPLDAPAEVYNIQPQQQDPFQAGFQDDLGETKLMKTLGGGTALMFEMVRKRMLDWGQPDPPKSTEPPRWHPHTGVSDNNPNFRKQAPSMNNAGFAKTIWRNVRKRNKPSLWKNALRTYDRMSELEGELVYIQRSNTHHEAAMSACSKLGDWQRALEIYHFVYQLEQESQQYNEAQLNQTQSKQPKPFITTATQPSATSSKVAKEKQVLAIKDKIKRQVRVTDNMILSLVRACVRASRQRSRHKNEKRSSTQQEEQEAALRRIPLDTALEILMSMKKNHNIALMSHHVNPLAAAYQSLGYIQEGRQMLQTMLSNRTAGEEPEDGVDILNVHDLCAKDKGSYSLLVQGAVVTGDWGAAVEALTDMTNAGLYPNKRHCNTWSEISERQTRRSWKKKRDDYWTDSVR